MLDTNYGSDRVDWCVVIYTVRLLSWQERRRGRDGRQAAEEPSLSPSVISHSWHSISSKSIFHANWTYRATMCTASVWVCEPSDAHVVVCVCVCVSVCTFEQSPRMCSPRLGILFTEPTRWQSFAHYGRHTPKHIQTPLPGSTVKLIYLSIASPVCLSGNPFHHSVILLSVCLHSSVIIRQKSVTHTSSPEPIRLYTSLRSEPRGPPERRTRTHTHPTLQELT